MKSYLCKDGERWYIDHSYSLRPKNTVVAIPESTPHEDYPYLYAEQNEEDAWELKIDMDAKMQAESAAQQAITQALWDQMKRERNRKLKDSDFTQLEDAPLSDMLKAEYAVYRQMLRDLPAAIIDINDFTWPTEPGA